MKSICLIVFSVLALTVTAQAQSSCASLVCRQNPTCQQLRDAGKCAEARQTLKSNAQQNSCANMVCNQNPTCQQLRNAGQCAAAREALKNTPSPGGGRRARY